MKRTVLAAGVAVLAGCNNIDTALVIQNVAAGDDKCVFDAKGDRTLGDITFDAAAQDSLFLLLRVSNALQTGVVAFGSDQVPDNYVIPNSVTPVRFDLRWECDSNGFSDDLGDLFLPQFSSTQPFCISDDTRKFVGFDVITASGPTIPPGNAERSLVEIRPITPQLGDALEDVFILADKAQKCCDDPPMGCDDASLQGKPMGPGTPCGDLQAEFDRIAPNKLSATTFADLQKFRPFRRFDHMAFPPKGGTGLGPAYPLKLRGVLEGVTADGSVVSSAEWQQVINICANCGGGSPCTNN